MPSPKSNHLTLLLRTWFREEGIAIGDTTDEELITHCRLLPAIIEAGRKIDEEAAIAFLPPGFGTTAQEVQPCRSRRPDDVRLSCLLEAGHDGRHQNGDIFWGEAV